MRESSVKSIWYMCFAKPSRTVFWNISFYICFNVHKLDDSFTFIWKKILCHIFLFLCHILPFGSFGLDAEFILRECRFSIKSKVSFMSSGDKPILTLQISVTNFCRFWHFADFDFKIVLLGQNSFQPFSFCWVEYCVI